MSERGGGPGLVALARGWLGGRTVVAGDGAQGSRPIHPQAAAEFGKLVWGCEEGGLPRDLGDNGGVETRWSPPGRGLFWHRQVRCGGSDVSLQLFLLGVLARTNGGPRACTRSAVLPGSPGTSPAAWSTTLPRSSLPAGRGGMVSSEGGGEAVQSKPQIHPPLLQLLSKAAGSLQARAVSGRCEGISECAL